MKQIKLGSVSANVSLRVVVRGEVRIFTRNRAYVIGRCLRPRDPRYINPNDPWFGFYSFKTVDWDNGRDMRFYIGKKVR